jgi:two-component system, chemotaxis family, sensor kinase CheA
VFDPEIVQDFLTESGELLEQLDRDLVVLESSPRDAELLNRVFRALHTIKGSASFLALTNLVTLAHAAENALNAARNGHVLIDKPAMDLLLAAVDVLKRQFEELREGRELSRADMALIAGLTALGEGKSASTASPALAHAGAAAVHAPAASAHAEPAPPVRAPASAEASTAGPRTESPLALPENKATLIDFLVPDLRESVVNAGAAADRLALDAERAAAASKLAELGESLHKNGEFFEMPGMERLAKALEAAGQYAAELPVEAVEQLLPRVAGILALLAEQAEGLSRGAVIGRPIDGLCGAVDAIVHGTSAPRALTPRAGAREALVADGVIPSDDPHIVAASAETPDVAGAGEARASTAPLSTTGPAPSPGAAGTPPAGAGEEPTSKSAASEQTIRVEVGRLETLLNLVGELVLQKNRLSAIARQAGSAGAGSQEFRENFAQAAGQLDRVTGDIQVAVMRTRMQPLDKLFGRYPRLIRDLSRKTGKDIRLVIEGGETEVDKSVIEELGDPLVHLIRNSADHGLETPEQRRAAGKPEHGTITLRASHEGSHVQIQIVDNGRGLSRKRIGAKAVERGLVSEQQLAQMTDRDVQRFIFAAGFSTADKVTDLSGRGVGMDVVKTNIEKIKGTIDLSSVEGQGTTVSIKIPLTVAIMTAMMIGIGAEVYAVPLSNVVEIVKPDASALSSIQTRPVMRLRDSVLPLLEGSEVFGLGPGERSKAPFAVVLQQGEQRVGLMVSRLIGQQEVVIKPLDGVVERHGPVSGATVRDDGGVSLIVDVNQMVQLAGDRAGTGG